MPTVGTFEINGIELTRDDNSIALTRDTPPEIEIGLLRQAVKITLAAGDSLSERITNATIAITEIAWVEYVTALFFGLEDGGGSLLMEDSGKLLLE